MSAETPAEIVLAAVAGAHGIGGAVRLKIFAQGLESLEVNKVYQAEGRSLTLVSLSPEKGGNAIARFAEIGSRNQAEALRGTKLSISREALPALEDGEYYHIDVIGRPVLDAAGALLGVVRGVENFGAGDIIEIDLPDGKTAMLPFRAPAVIEVEGQLIVDPVWLA